jgi:hypothetical protein
MKAGIGGCDRLVQGVRTGHLDGDPFGGQGPRHLGHQASHERGPTGLGVHLHPIGGVPGDPGIGELPRPRQVPVHRDVAGDDHAAGRSLGLGDSALLGVPHG